MGEGYAERWDFAKALDLAQERLKSAGISIEDLIPTEPQHVGRARRMAEIAAPAMMRQHLAVVLGTSPDELDRFRGGFRIMLEGIKTSLSMVGLRAGEEVSLDLSERMQGFLTKWQERRSLAPAETEIIEAEAQRVMPTTGSGSGAGEHYENGHAP